MKPAQKTIPWLQRFARFGYMCQGTVFILIGILALLAAFNLGGDTENTTGALRSLSRLPFGQFLLFAIGFGLIGYIMLMLLKTFKDVDDHGTALGGLFQRGTYLFSALVYSIICIQSFRFALHQFSQDTYNETTFSSYLLSKPYGAMVVFIIGIGILLAGLMQFYFAMTNTHRDGFKSYEMTQKEKHFATMTGKVGFGARSILFMMIGYFFMITAHRSDPNEARGFDDALATLQQQPFGDVWLAIVAFGLVAYGVYAFVRAYYEQMRF
ncbi:hypothetical protein DH09_17225 [Bacillaceae bacterium JMAK1]|nr:hypothetical protein DH09_17225 [Bacillaceae bacterium JMAK1]